VPPIAVSKERLEELAVDLHEEYLQEPNSSMLLYWRDLESVARELQFDRAQLAAQGEAIEKARRFVERVRSGDIEFEVELVLCQVADLLALLPAPDAPEPEVTPGE